MGSPVSGIVCDLYMEEYEEKALSAAKHPPRWWKRYVDDTHTVLKKGYSQEFTDHLNSIDEDIKWTTEGETLHGEERTLAFLDTMSVVHDDGHISTRVYRKDTHTDQYLNFESNHPLEHKRGVVNTLMYRADMVVSEPAEREKEKGHIKDALSVNGYPKWMFKTRTTNKPSNKNKPSDSRGAKKPHIVIPYIRGVSEKLRHVYQQFGIPTYFKPNNTLRQILVRPKDTLSKDKIVGPVYHIPCNDCTDDYVGETERSLKARFSEHGRPSSTSSEVSRHIHTASPKHSINLENTDVLTVEPRWFERGVKEAIYIKAYSPSLNKDGGRYQLPPIWNTIIKDRVHKRETGTSKGGARSVTH